MGPLCSYRWGAIVIDRTIRGERQVVVLIGPEGFNDPVPENLNNSRGWMVVRPDVAAHRQARVGRQNIEPRRVVIVIKDAI